ncbi:hypothetical protein SSX86_015697 [Deinandra increscens subsp. villosa]|uniref:Uncharacterized protein n=1 Tax=Deinandra increscens subsp. villosa TaxID=3103831 RepID=A0AAP0GXQ9_9ASTR
MDESWRMRMGSTASTKLPLPPRRSSEDNHTDPANGGHVRGYGSLDPEDFDDVFGGPPRSVLSRQYSVDGDFAKAAAAATGVLFEDMFRKPNRSDRTLPEFRIPGSKSGGGCRSEEEFYSDIFGNSRRSRSRSESQTCSYTKSKSNSSSILSSEELSPFRPAVGDDDDDVCFSSFAAKLRPINVSSKWNTTNKMHEVQPMADSPCNSHAYESDYTHKFKGSYPGFSQRVSSPEITTFGPNSYTSVKESIEDLQVNSPASIVSSVNQDQEDETSTINEEDDELMSSFVIEINPSRNCERIGESLGVDEAIAWAKQKCQTRNFEKECDKGEDQEHGCSGVEEVHGVNTVPEVQINESRESSSLDKENVWTIEEPVQELEEDVSLCKQMELELLDEDIKLWSEGKESNIRLLLSTLHHILWPSSGWIMIPITNLKESPNVKKAYQKARLCLHPDKLQQRGATISQKYVAEKAFPILQDAWAAFISQDVLLSIT